MQMCGSHSADADVLCSSVNLLGTINSHIHFYYVLPREAHIALGEKNKTEFLNHQNHKYK